MAAFEHRDRLTSLSKDNHQPWLWFVHVFSLVFVSLAAIVRARIKRRYYGIEDILLLFGHAFYIAYWVVLLMALLSSLGKSESVTSPADVTRASMLVFSSRILLTLILCTVKLSNVFLIYNIFTKSVKPSRISLDILLGLIVAQGLIGPLVLSAGCSSDRMIGVGENAACSNITARWIVFTAFETALEVAPIARVISQVLRLQVGQSTKVFVVAAFSSKLVVLIPAWIHLGCYQRFLQYERPNIGIVPTIISEELWASISLFSASIPVLMRVAKRFTTSREVGDRTASGSRYNKSSRSKKTPDQSFEMASSNSHSNWQPHRNKAVSYLNEDNYTAAVLPGKSAPESINSTSESQVGILREVQVEVSSLHVQKRIPGISVAS